MIKYNNVWIVHAHENGVKQYGFAFTDYHQATEVFEKGQQKYPELKWYNTYYPLDVKERAKYQMELLKLRNENE